MKVVVGLGNPGKEYSGTRHNIGWMLLDSLAERLGAGRFGSERTVDAAEAWADGEKIYLLKPKTYMNLSGQALSSWFARFREVAEAVREKRPEDAAAEPKGGPGRRQGTTAADAEEIAACQWPGMLVAMDDVNLPLGRMRFRPSGSAGGHNGLKDIEKAFGGRAYPRLRLGVGEPPGRMDRADYVLSRFASSEAPVLEKTLAAAVKGVEEWLRSGIGPVMNKYNGLTLDFNPEAPKRETPERQNKQNNA